MDSYIDGNPYHESNNKITSNILELWQGKISNIPMVREVYRWYTNIWRGRQATVWQDISFTSVQRTRNVSFPGSLSTDLQNIIPVLLYTEIITALLQQRQDKYTVKKEAGEEKEIHQQRDIVLTWKKLKLNSLSCIL